MARRTRKCQWCKVSDTPKEEMEVEYVGKNKTPKYYHKDCYKKFLEDKAFKEKERNELDKLVEVIKKIYGVKTLPTSAYPYLQQLRNGEEFFGRYQKRRKEGYDYSTIAEAFEYCSDTIEYWNSVKPFNGFINAFRYGLAIVCDKLPLIDQRRKQREKNKELIAKHIEQMEESIHEFQTSYKKPSNKTDISDFLDD